MAVADVERTDAAGEIDEFAPVDVPERAPSARATASG
jgi:hypothetical protein